MERITLPLKDIQKVMKGDLRKRDPAVIPDIEKTVEAEHRQQGTRIFGQDRERAGPPIRDGK